MAGQSERVRGIVLERYLQPALRAGKTQISVRARDVLGDAEATPEFPRGRTPMICNVLRSGKLLKGTGLAIEREEGPPSMQSRKVVIHYKVEEPSLVKPAIDGRARAEHFVRRMQELLGPGVAEYGGAEKFVRWVRYDEDPGS